MQSGGKEQTVTNPVTTPVPVKVSVMCQFQNGGKFGRDQWGLGHQWVDTAPQASMASARQTVLIIRAPLHREEREPSSYPQRKYNDGHYEYWYYLEFAGGKSHQKYNDGHFEYWYYLESAEENHRKIQWWPSWKLVMSSVCQELTRARIHN